MRNASCFSYSSRDGAASFPDRHLFIKRGIKWWSGNGSIARFSDAIWLCSRSEIVCWKEER
ncbi:MAG TPA: hypothetical protein DD727_01915 [Clostridiales bacterium]|nr:hypothetical protein [Clostridiales bacterium]